VDAIWGVLDERAESRILADGFQQATGCLVCAPWRFTPEEAGHSGDSSSAVQGDDGHRESLLADGGQQVPAGLLRWS
jgi:hypothetical protein